MPAYPITLPQDNTPDTSSRLSPSWSLARRKRHTWDRNAHHVSGGHSIRRVKLERQYERAERMRLNLAQAAERAHERDPRDEELGRLARDLRMLTPEAVGAMVDPKAVGPGGGKRSAFYLPFLALPFASLLVRIVKRAMKWLRYAGRVKLLDHVRATAAWLQGALARPSPPHSPPPQTPEVKPKVEISSEVTSLKEGILAYMAKVQAMQPAEYRPNLASAGPAGEEAR